MRPYIFSHMMASVDGRIDCPMVDKLSGDEYYAALDKLGPCSKLSGRTTAALECPAVCGESACSGVQPVGRESVGVCRRADEYAIVTDTRGRLRWQAGEADGVPLLCLVSEAVSENYLEKLRALGISWIATGREAIDLPRAMEILREQFGVERLAIVGGGHINGGFLHAGLIDEVSIMVAPGIDGRKGQTAVFDGLPATVSVPFKLRLESVKQWPGTETVWLRYKVAPAR